MHSAPPLIQRGESIFEKISSMGEGIFLEPVVGQMDGEEKDFADHPRGMENFHFRHVGNRP